MKHHLASVEFVQIAEDVKAHLASLPSATDSFHEEHVLKANHYQIIVDETVAGFASIHEQGTIIQFALAESYRHLGQPVYARLRGHEHVRTALVPTNDEFFLAHALDDYRQLSKQACFFALASTRVTAIPGAFSLRLAGSEDLDAIQRESGDFFEDPEKHIEQGELFLTERDSDVCGFGIMQHSTLHAQTASIGMFTMERARNQGVGAATIGLLIAECQRRGIKPVAGCWYYNHASKRTLEKAGMYSPTRYLKVEYREG